MKTIEENGCSLVKIDVTKIVKYTCTAATCIVAVIFIYRMVTQILKSK